MMVAPVVPTSAARRTRAANHREAGSVLLCALIIVALIATLGVALSLTVSTESAVAANYLASQQALFAAEAGIERAVSEVRVLPAWTALPASVFVTAGSDFNDGQSMPRGPDGSTLNLTQITLMRQAASDAVYPNAPDRPLWHLFGHASLNGIAATTGGAAPYVVVWFADDPDDLDGNPAIDSNDVVMIHAEAFGIRGGKRAIEVTIAREVALAADLPGATRSDVHLIAWHEVR